MVAEPGLVRDDVQQGRGPGEIRVSGDDRVVDALVLVARKVERAAFGDPVPKTRSHRARRQAAEECAQDAVARRAGDHIVEGGIGLDELVGAVARGSRVPGPHSPETIRSRIRSIASSVTLGRSILSFGTDIGLKRTIRASAACYRADRLTNIRPLV